MALFFWIIDLLIPVIITGIGLLFTYKPPRRINVFCGYRAAR